MKKHQDESGKPATNRGLKPHKGGYHAAKGKNVNPFKVWVDKNGAKISTMISNKRAKYNEKPTKNT